MGRLRSPRNWSLFVGVLSVILATLACVNGVSPIDPDLQPPLTNTGIQWEDFMEQIDVFPVDSIPPPWITVPPTKFHTIESQLSVSGWAVNKEDRPGPDHPDRQPQIHLYQVPTRKVPSDDEVVRFLVSTKVPDSRKWLIDSVPISDDPFYLAARVVVGDQLSGFSNVIIVNQTEPAALIIDSPQDNSEIDTGKVTLSGRGQPTQTLRLKVIEQAKPEDRSSEEKPPVEQLLAEGEIGEDGTWELPEVELGWGENNLVLSTDLADQFENQMVEITLERPPHYRITWPHGTGQGENYVPDFNTGEISTWYGPNDFHIATYPFDPHTGIDIAGNPGEAVKAVASGIVTEVFTETLGGWHVIVTHGDGWSTGYFHLKDAASDTGDGEWSNGYVTETNPIEVGERIGTVGNSGTGAIGEHLHLELREPGGAYHNLNPPKSNEAYFKGKLVDLYDWWGKPYIWDFDWGNEPVLMHWETRLKGVEGTEDDDYNKMCPNDLKNWVWPGEVPFKQDRRNGLGFRTRYCELYPNKCPDCE